MEEAKLFHQTPSAQAQAGKTLLPMVPSELQRKRKGLGLKSRMKKAANKMLDAFDRFWLDPEDVKTTLWYYEHNRPSGANGSENDSEVSYYSDYSSSEETDSDTDSSDCDEEKEIVDDNVETVVIDKMEYLLDRRTGEVFAYDVQSPMFVGLMRQDGSLQRAPPGPAALAMMSDPERRGPVLPDPTLAHIRGAAAASSLDAQALNAVFWEAQRSLAHLPEHIERLPLAGGGRVYHNTRTGEVSHRHPIHAKYVALLGATSRLPGAVLPTGAAEEEDPLPGSVLAGTTAAGASPPPKSM